MIGDVTFYPNYLWYKGFNVATYPRVIFSSFTSSGGETSDPVYDLVDARRTNLLTMSTNGNTSAHYYDITTSSNINNADFCIVDNHNYYTAGSKARIIVNSAQVDLSGYWAGSLGSQLSSQTYDNTYYYVTFNTDGIFLAQFSSPQTGNDHEVAHTYVSSSYTDDTTIGEWYVGKSFTMSYAPEMPIEISNYDGVQIGVTAGGQKIGYARYGERKAWRLSWKYITESDKDSFLEVWQVTNGSQYPFYIDLGENNNPTLYYVRFVENSVQLEKLTAGAYRLSFLIESEV